VWDGFVHDDVCRGLECGIILSIIMSVVCRSVGSFVQDKESRGQERGIVLSLILCVENRSVG
jgi:hypothetical protein